MRSFVTTTVVFMCMSTVVGNQAYAFGVGLDGQSENDLLSPEVRARKKSADQILVRLNTDMGEWIDQHFSSGIALKKKDKYIRKVTKFQTKFENLYAKCGFHTENKKTKGEKQLEVMLPSDDVVITMDEVVSSTDKMVVTTSEQGGKQKKQKSNEIISTTEEVLTTNELVITTSEPKKQKKQKSDDVVLTTEEMVVTTSGQKKLKKQKAKRSAERKPRGIDSILEKLGDIFKGKNFLLNIESWHPAKNFAGFPSYLI